MVVQADGERAETAEATATVVTATRAGAVAGQGVGAIGQTVQMAAGNPVPGSAATGSGGSVPTAGGGKKLVRYGRGPKRREIGVSSIFSGLNELTPISARSEMSAGIPCFGDILK